MTTQIVAAATAHCTVCTHCGQPFITQLRNVTFNRSEDKTRVWFEARCFHCGTVSSLSCEDARKSVDAEVLRRAFEKYHWEHP